MFNIPKLNLKVVSNDGSTGVFEFSPLIKGFGHTLGSVMRRTLYSATEGSVITRVQIEGVSHQFTTIQGMKDDVLRFALNLKKVRFKKTVDGAVELDLNVTGPATVTGADIEEMTGCKVVNPEIVLTELADKKSKIKAKLTVETGSGYVPAPEEVNAPIGTIFLDANFSPIYNVSLLVEETRVGREINYDKLTLTLRTDGSLDPELAIRQAAKSLKEYFYRIETGEDYKEELDKLMEEEESEEVASVASVPADEVSLEELHLPTRTINALKKSGIKTLGDLADRSEDDLLRIRNLGEKSIREIIALLERENLK
jgi:DNA-directed RNA polymerase subunit alpha